MPNQMADSQLRTVTIPGTPTNNPACIATAMTDRPMRVMVSNVGPVPCRLAFSSSQLGGVTSEGVDHFELAVGASGISLILNAKQKLYAVASGATGRISVATSDALPFEVPS